MSATKIPFLNLAAQHTPIRAELDAAIAEVIDSSAFAGGPFVARFEAEFAEFCQTRHAIGVGNGTDALWFALLALGIGPGDEVITVPNTFIATAEAISFTGATPRFVDVEEDSHLMNCALVEAAITPRTKAIIPVHLFGQMVDMDPLMEIARRHGLWVIEDACQAHGAEYRGRKAGSIGHAGCFSFYPGKNLGALGEAGGVVTNDAVLADKIRVLRDHGQYAKYQHSTIGWNGRMDGIQAAVLRVKLKNLASGNAARRLHAARYDELLADLDGVVIPAVPDGARSAFHLYVLRVPQRDALLTSLGERGVSCAIHYPTPIHLQPAYASLGLGAGSFPVAEQLAREIISLPMYPELTPVQIERVTYELKSLVVIPSVEAVVG